MVRPLDAAVPLGGACYQKGGTFDSFVEGAATHRGHACIRRQFRFTPAETVTSTQRWAYHILATRVTRYEWK